MTQLQQNGHIGFNPEYELSPPPPPSRLEILLKQSQSVALFFLCLFSFSNCVSIAALKNRRTPALVQSADGFGVAIQAQDSNYRSEAVLKGFISDWITLTYDWEKQQKLGQQKIPDLGLPILHEKVPTGILLGSLVLERSMILGWLKTMTDTYDFDPYLRGQRTKKMRIEKIIIKDLGQGTYQAKVAATWIETASRGSLGSQQPWNYTFTLQTIYPQKNYFVDADDQPMLAAAYAIFNRGLIITDFEKI